LQATILALFSYRQEGPQQPVVSTYKTFRSGSYYIPWQMRFSGKKLFVVPGVRDLLAQVFSTGLRYDA
jgi:hypothetical protein